jgi:hypothetical protein
MLTITSAKNPKYAQDNNFICLEVTFQEFGDRVLPFAASASDPEQHGRELYARAKAGEFGEIALYVAPTPTAEQNKESAVNLLNQTDWTSIADVADPAVSNPYLMNQAEFLTYRSQLREIAINPTAGFITFPTMPQEQWNS